MEHGTLNTPYDAVDELLHRMDGYDLTYKTKIAEDVFRDFARDTEARVRAEYAPIVKAAEAVDGFLHLPNNSWATDVYPEGHQALDDLRAALADLKETK